LINAKSGVSYWKIGEKGGPLEKTVGSVFGEATLSGMCRLLRPNDNERPSQLAHECFTKGHSSKVDLTVGDIYGDRCDSVGLGPKV
jgi:pantothenate kinase